MRFVFPGNFCFAALSVKQGELGGSDQDDLILGMVEKFDSAAGDLNQYELHSLDFSLADYICFRPAFHSANLLRFFMKSKTRIAAKTERPDRSMKY